MKERIQKRSLAQSLQLLQKEKSQHFSEKGSVMEFELHPNLQKKIQIIDLELSKILMEDSAFYPWLFLVPRKNNLSKIIDLSRNDQLILMQELEIAQNILIKEFNPAQINVAAIGIKTPQLHIHVIARYKDDPAWPNTVWDHPIKKNLTEEDKQKRVYRLRESFREHLSNSFYSGFNGSAP